MSTAEHCSQGETILIDYALNIRNWTFKTKKYKGKKNEIGITLEHSSTFQMNGCSEQNIYSKKYSDPWQIPTKMVK